MSSKHKQFKRFTFVCGASKYSFAVGFGIDAWSAHLNLGFVWMAIEW